MGIKVTMHACERFADRVCPCSLEEAHERILAATRGIEAAAAFDTEFANACLIAAARLVLDGLTVVTGYERHALPRQCRGSPYRLSDATLRTPQS